MSRRGERLIPVRTGRRLLAPRDSVELVGMSIRPPEHFTRLWPTGPDAPVDLAFLLLMWPLRLLALALLWATSAPSRTGLTALLIVAVFLAH